MTTDVRARASKQAIYITAFALKHAILADASAKFLKFEFSLLDDLKIYEVTYQGKFTNSVNYKYS